MTIPTRLLPGQLAALALVLGGCSDRPDAGVPERAGSQGTDRRSAVGGALASQQRNVIELTVDGARHRADTAGNHSLWSQGDARHHLDLRAAWVADGDFGMIGLAFHDLSADTGSLALAGDGGSGVVLQITGIPGLRDRRWRSQEGSLELVALTLDADGVLVLADGHFDGHFAELDRHRNEVLPGQDALLHIAGNFRFQPER